MGTSTAKKPETPPTAVELAAQVVELTRRRAEIDAEYVDAQEKTFAMEKTLLNGGKVVDTQYRAARNAQGDLEARMVALDRLLEDTTAQGVKTLADEAIKAEIDAKAERGSLIRARREAIEGRLMPVFAEFIVVREMSTGLGFNSDDSVYLGSIPKLGFGPEEKRALFAEMERLKGTIDMKNSLGNLLQTVEDDIRRLTTGRIPTFEKLVELAGNEQ